MGQLDGGKSSNTIIHETDWLASEPVFYNLKTGKASKKINEIIPTDNNFNFMVLAQAMGTLVFLLFINKTRKSFFMMIKAFSLIDLLKFKTLVKS